MYNDHRIRSLICMVCAQIKLDSGGSNSEIEFVSGSWFFTLPPGALAKNCSMKIFQERYCQSGSPLATVGNQSTQDIQNPSFAEWSLTVYSKWLDIFPRNLELTEAQIGCGEDLTCDALLCCPEDRECCTEPSVAENTLCPACRIPVCHDCQIYFEALRPCRRSEGVRANKYEQYSEATRNTSKSMPQDIDVGGSVLSCMCY